MDKKILSLLQTIDQRSKNIEQNVFEQNDRIATLENQLRSGNKQSRIETGHSQTSEHGRNDNFMNQLKDEIDHIEYSKVEDRKGTRVQKSASLQEKRRPKSVKSRRFPHTVPSDKDEETRRNAFRKECLSKAVQWHLVDLIKAMPEDYELVLSKWLPQKEFKIVQEGRHTNHNSLRRFLCLLMKKEFIAMQEWLNSCDFASDVITQVWQTFEEFSDEELNRTKMKCFKCKLLENVDVADVVDYLFSASAISEDLYMKVIDTKLPVGTQQTLWNSVLKECEKKITDGNISPETVVLALKIALKDYMKDSATSYSLVLETLLSEIDTNMNEPRKLMLCFCKELCSKHFHPISCSLSLASFYFSSPQAGKSSSKPTGEVVSRDTFKKSAESVSSGDAPVSSISPSSSVDLCEENKINTNKLLKADEEQIIDPSGAGDLSVVSGPLSAPALRARERRPRSKKSRDRERELPLISQSKSNREIIAHSESSLESTDGGNNGRFEGRVSQKITSKLYSNQQSQPHITFHNVKSVSIHAGSGPLFNVSKKLSDSSSSNV